MIGRKRRAGLAAAIHLALTQLTCSTSAPVAPAPVLRATTPPGSSSAPAAPVLPAAPPAAIPPAPSAEPPRAASGGCQGGDPLLNSCDPKGCGAPPDNPHGYLLPSRTRDGSCRAQCRTPRPLAQCRDLRAHALSLDALQNNVGRSTRIRGLLGFYPAWCTKRAGRCACANACWGTLRLVRAPDDWWGDPEVTARHGVVRLRAPPGAAGADDLSEFVNPEAELVCHGDDGSVCCPYALDHETNSADVIVSGKLTASPDNPGEFQISFSNVCRVSAPRF